VIRYKNIIIVFCILNSLRGYSQLQQIYTGSNATLRDLSVINGNIMISGWHDYLAHSNDECNTLIPLTIPGPTGYITRIQRLDANTVFLLSYTPSETYLYKSTDGGNNWVQKSNTTGAFNHEIGFFDSTEALMTDGPYLLRTTNGGSSWTNISSPFQIGMTSIKTYDDSLVCIVGVDVLSGGIRLSKDRGHTWPFGWGLGYNPTDIFFLNKDTVFGVSQGGGFTKTMNGGTTWDGSSEPPINNCYGVYFKNANEGYMIGANQEGSGLILKTIDLGKTWSTFNTGIKTTLLNMAILNDSIAILTGTGGVLLKWNYTNTVFTGLNEKQPDRVIRLFPNPVTHELQFSNSSGQEGYFNISIRNTIGQVVYSDERSDLSEPIEVSHLAKGVYFISLQSGGQQKVLKFMKQ
jgi:photosystem II stability/assembly factor-like uncharacterized protein